MYAVHENTSFLLVCQYTVDFKKALLYDSAMRKIIVSEFVTLDGVMEGPGHGDSFKMSGWSMAYGSAEIMKFKFDELFAGDAILLGRLTYEGFASAWPKMTGAGEFGERMNSIPKLVVSTTLEKAEWQNSTHIKGDVVEEITKLKQQPGKDILVFGSSELVKTLIQNDFIDEYRLLIYPVVLGTGKRLFKDDVSLKLALLESKAFSTGVVLNRYSAAK
jgi:dihydrofolate reductase